MKRIYFIGDIKGNTGPAVVNKSYKLFLENEVFFCNSNNKIYRVFHLLVHLPSVDTVLLSGFSKLNSYLIAISKLLNKKTFYLMHGYIYDELKFKEVNNTKAFLTEDKIFQKSDKIICVSKFFCDYMKKEKQEIKDKFMYINSGIETQKIENLSYKNNCYTIISVGGGRRQKNNLKVCQAIQKLKIKKIKYIVIGNEEIDGEEIKKYTFVEYYKSLPHEEVLKKMSQSNLYIQNSYFETFGLSIAEAVNCGCDILISQNIGIKDLFKNIDENDIIFDNNNVTEIKQKILSKMKNSKEIVYDSLECSWKNRSEELLKILKGED